MHKFEYVKIANKDMESIIRSVWICLILVGLTVFSCTSSAKPSVNSQSSKNEPKAETDSSALEAPKANWRNPVMSPMGADISRIVRGYFLVGDYNKMLQFVITPPCYSRKQIEQIIRKSTWGYAIRMTNLSWLPDSTFVITYITTKNNTTGSEQYVGRIVNDTAKIIMFPEKKNLFQYFGDEDLGDLCKLKNALDNIYFKFDKALILPSSNQALTTLLNYLKTNKQLSAHFVGHSSNEGTMAHNQTLSEERAKAICDYLIKKGIAESRLTYEGKGDKFPISPNDTEANRALNRRVELVLSEE